MLPATVPTVGGDRVTLREYEAADAILVKAATTDSLVPLMTTVPANGSDAQVMSYISRQQGRLSEGHSYQFVIVDNATAVPVGQIGMLLRDIDHGRASIGYWIGAAHRRQGYAVSALREIVSWAQSLPEVARLELYVEPWNQGSWRAAEAAGFQREGLLRGWETVWDERRDMYMYALLLR